MSSSAHFGKCGRVSLFFIFSALLPLSGSLNQDACSSASTEVVVNVKQASLIMSYLTFFPRCFSFLRLSLPIRLSAKQVPRPMHPQGFVVQHNVTTKHGPLSSLRGWAQLASPWHSWRSSEDLITSILQGEISWCFF